MVRGLAEFHANRFAKQFAAAIRVLRSLDAAREFAMLQVNDQLVDGCNVDLDCAQAFCRVELLSCV